MRLGIVGCGAFGQYALEHMPGIQVVVASDVHEPAAQQVAQRFGARIGDPLTDPEVELVYLATPPFAHHQQALTALRHGKHVLCEKPLAIDLQQADEMLAEAQARQRLCVVHLLQRYNPLATAVRHIVEERLLGEPLHGFFENYASDENLSGGHWFWNAEKSGGIFVEHGVHFFDLFRMWLGEGAVESAGRVLRPGSGLEEQVYCTARYGAVPVQFYHGFTQPKCLDRQELRLLFEHGDITLHEWIPTRLVLRGLVEDTRRLQEIFPGAELRVLDASPVSGRHKAIDCHHHVELTTPPVQKADRYAECITAFIRDQLAWIADPTHPRRITEANGHTSLAMATTARHLACG